MSQTLQARPVSVSDIPTDVQQLAKKKGIKLEKRCKASQQMCADCEGPLREGTGTWYEQQIMYFEEPMIKFWITWSNDLSPAAYSWPIGGEKRFRCTTCFDEFENSRKMTPTPDKAKRAATKMGVTLYTDGPYFPGKERRRCKVCNIPLTNRGWYASPDTSKNSICWDVRGDSLVVLAYKLQGQINVFVCKACYSKQGGKI